MFTLLAIKCKVIISEMGRDAMVKLGMWITHLHYLFREIKALHIVLDVSILLGRNQVFGLK